MQKDVFSKVDKAKSEPARILRVNTNIDKTEAYITIDYFASSDGSPAPFYKKEEIRDELNKISIIYGILEENLIKCTSGTKISNLLIAKGEKAVEGEDDNLKLKFEVDSDLSKLQEDSRGRIDFKNIGAVNAVLKGEVIAVKASGNEGIAGTNVFGAEIKPRPIKKIKLRAGQGCQLINEDEVIASIDGKPCVKNNTFYVYNVHEINHDVDLSTGNITFLGDIKVTGSVKEGMKVLSGNSITIMQNVEGALVQGKNDITVNGNIINSTIVGGGEDSDKIKEIEQLTLMTKLLNEMVSAIEEIKKFNLLGYDTSDGQIIKLLIDSKFKALPMACMGVISQAVKAKQHGDNKYEELISLVRKKLIALGPLTVKHYSEIIEILDISKRLLEQNSSHKTIPVNVKLNYSQDSTIVSSGNVVFSGKGTYVSTITALDSIYFLQEKSVVRGGNLKAENEISCKVVGSPGGVSTKLMVSEKGHIKISIAYENTVLYIGSREFVLDNAYKDLHAYINNNNELVVDKLKL